MLTYLRNRPFRALILTGAVFIGSLAAGTYADNGWQPTPTNHAGAYRVTPVYEDGSVAYSDGASWDADTRTFTISAYVGEDPDPGVDAYNWALSRALVSAGYVGLRGDECECIDVPEGTTVDVPGYGPWTA